MKKIAFIISTILTPTTFIFAAFDTRSLSFFVESFVKFLSTAALPTLVGVALLFFIWGIVNFIKNADSASERAKWKSVFVWGIIALFLMVSIIAVLGVLTKSTTGDSVILPQLQIKTTT